MARAEVGDDVYGEDPTVIALEAKVAGLLGKEAALYVSSGTQSNLLGVLAHCQRGEEYLIGDVYHVYKSEALGTSGLGGVACYPMKTDANGGLDPEQVLAGIKPDDPHSPMTRLLCLENTVSGRVQDQDRIEALAATARDFRRALRWEEADKLLERAVAIDPNSPDANTWYAYGLALSGRCDHVCECPWSVRVAHSCSAAVGWWRRCQTMPPRRVLCAHLTAQ